MKRPSALRVAHSPASAIRLRAQFRHGHSHDRRDPTRHVDRRRILRRHADGGPLRREQQRRRPRPLRACRADGGRGARHAAARRGAPRGRGPRRAARRAPGGAARGSAGGVVGGAAADAGTLRPRQLGRDVLLELVAAGLVRAGGGAARGVHRRRALRRRRPLRALVRKVQRAGTGLTPTGSAQTLSEHDGCARVHQGGIQLVARDQWCHALRRD